MTIHLILLLHMITGGHTLGFAHCSSFQNRIHSFSSTLDVDPSLQSSFANSLRSVCPAHNKVKSAGTTLDSTTTTFDNAYFKLLLQGKSIFSSDQALLTNPTTKALVYKFASSQKKFENAFVKSIIKMSSITGGQEIRLECKAVRWSIRILSISWSVLDFTVQNHPVIFYFFLSDKVE